MTDSSELKQRLAHLTAVQLSDVPLLSAAERQRLLVEWNNTSKDYPRDKCIHELFEEQAQKTPARVAVVFEDRGLTYRELDLRANKVAQHLRSLGVGPEILVGVYLERSLELVVAIIGVLKAGGAYLALDTSYPVDRTEFMLADASVALLITHETLAARLQGYAGGVLAIDLAQLAIGVDCEVDLDVRVTADNTAYVLYTSGSTGKPKGVVITHRALCNHMFWMASEFPLKLDDAVLQKTPVSFDVSVCEFFAPLTAGARLVVARPFDHTDPKFLADIVQRQQITTLHVVPTMLRMLVEEPGFSRCTSLRLLLVAGEALPLDLAHSAATLLRAEIYNLYGPTEATIFATFFRYDGRTHGITVPIGCPLANIDVYVLDHQQEIQPIGVPGELYLGGVGLARGYLNRPELTKDRFVPHPFCPDSGARLYRTGDLVRWQPDGNLEFLGRLDHQLKIRGNRVELGEIRAALLNHPDIQDALVTSFDNGDGGMELAAYWVPKKTAVPEGGLRAFLRTCLPDYMVPTAVVRLQKIPLSPNGKVDYKALPIPTRERSDRQECVPPRTPAEQVLAAIWQEVLQVQAIGVHDNFFELGGHSLLATRAALRIRRALEVELPLRVFFEFPTIAGLSEKLRKCRDEATSLLPALLPVARDRPLPLSFAQQRLWFLDRLEDSSTVYHITEAVRIRGDLDRDALERAINGLVDRHESLRTHFVEVEGEPIQVVAPEMHVALRVEDLSEAVPREEAIIASLRRECDEPFNLSLGPLLRMKLISLGRREHILLWTCHHIISDGWSVGVFNRELAVLYDAFRTGRDNPLPPLPVQYADYTLWQRQWLQGERLERPLGYWRNRLAHAPALELPTDRPRAARQTYVGARHTFVVTGELSARLNDFNRREKVTPFMSLLAAFQVLLARYSGQDDFLVGTPIANRQQVEVEDLIGFFVNTLVMRADLSGQPGFREVVSRMRLAALEAQEHQDVPFEKLVEELSPERDLSRHPLFQVMFALQNTPAHPLTLTGMEAVPHRLPVASTHFDLELHLWPEDKTWTGMFSYNTDLFDAATVERMAVHYRTLLEAMLATPERPISDVPLLTAGERHQLLVEWNDTVADYPRDKCIHELFEEQAEKSPEAVAVEFEDRQLTYRELNCKANQLAHHLRGLGVGPDVLVGVHLDRSVEMVVALLGVLKAGGAYVPLAKDYPTDRLRFMLQDSAAQVVIAAQALPQKLRDGRWVLVDLKADADLIAAASPSNLQKLGNAESPAYVMYTSGSTGQPKGAAIAHRGVVRLVRGQTYAEFGRNQRFLWLASPAFDASTFELWGPLVNGATCVVCAERLPDFESLEGVIRRSKVTCLWLTASLFNAIIDQRPSALDGVRHVLTGGEALSVTHVERASKLFPDLRLTNGYGPTESTTFACTFDIKNHMTFPTGSVAIGRPIAHTRVYILDEQKLPVPIGIPGELYIGGDGVAIGYVNRPELTAHRFVADPFSLQGGSRLYRTGDLCRYRRDGNIEFLGRTDCQVKLRGFRVELGEIEVVLMQHPQVRQAVVLLREDRPGDKRLAAYLVPQSAATPPAAADLRRHLHDRLPDYMVPPAFVFLDALPLTPNGKVDRKALAASDESRPDLETDYVAPRNPVEESLAAIWCELLGIEQVGIHDNFFKLGGHSLLATRVRTRMLSGLQVNLPLRKLFEAPTIAELSSEVEAECSGGEVFQGKPLQRISRNELDRLPLSFAQERLWFLDQLDRGSPTYNISWAVRLRGHLNLSALERSLQEVVKRHEALRTTYMIVDGVPRAVVLESAAFCLVVTDLRGVPETDRDAQSVGLASEEAGRPFDLARDLMLRAQLLQLRDQDQVLVLTMHHIASDGWSVGVFSRELAALYEAFAQDQTSPLPELPIQYQDYAVWQRDWLQGEVLEQQLAYWKEQLAGAPATLELPTDFPRPPVASYCGARREVVLDAKLTQALQALSRREAVTPFMLLLAAWQVLLSRYSAQQDVSVGAPIAGRNRMETEGLIGFFVNTLVLRTSLSGNPTFRELLGRVREVTLGAYAHQDLPFEKLVEELRPQRSRGHSPLFQVMFALQNAPSGLLELPGVTVSQLSVDNPTAKFDLTLSLGERNDQLQGVLEYSTDLFQAATIERLIGHFKSLLEGIVADAGQRIGALTMLTESERHQLLVTWNATATDYPRDKCLHQLFEEQVERTPDAVAVVFEEQHLSYRGLNERANQLADHLRRLGVASETLVGLCLERSPELIIGILGILKAGGAYVPLAVNHPLQRVEFMLDDAAIQFLVTTAAIRNRLSVTEVQMICLDGDSQPWKSGVRHNPTTETLPGHMAYVMYTSGSTGRPKGVQIPHRNVSNFLTSMRRNLGIQATDQLLSVTAPTFDISVLEFFLPLTVGASVELFSSQIVADGKALAQRLETSRGTILQATPASWQMLLQSGWKGDRKWRLLCGGEAMLPNLARSLSERCGQLWNMYGPTETTIWSTMHRVNPDVDGNELIPIGRPIANTNVYVLDAHRNPVPIGVPGELYIGGDGLARGYLRRPELTAEKFLHDPFSMGPGARMYRTGDQVRWCPDGNLEFLGRCDHQVKLRGFRVELGEIEVVLMQHPQVRQAVVLLREDRPGDKRLAAYLVPQSAATPPAAADLRRHLHDRLPDYMVPPAFVFLDALPLTPNGKVDRKALAASDESRPDLETDYVAPRNPVEESLAAIWCELLGIEQVGIHDDFFKLGGHSLLGVQLIERINRRFNAALRIADLFRLPTVEQLASILASPQREPLVDDFLSVLRPSTVRGSVVWIGGHIAGLLKSLPQSIGILRLGLDGMDTDTFHRFDVEATVDCYATELLRACPQGPLVIAGFSYSGLLAYALALRLRRELAERVVAVLLEPSYPQPSEIRGPRSLLMRIGRYCRKLYRGGPIVLYHSLRYRLDHYWEEPPPHLDAESLNKWNLCWPHFHHNITTYTPSHTLQDGLYIIAGSSWLTQHLSTFQTELKENPHVCGAGDVAHLDVPQDERCVASWIRLINDILETP